MQFVDFFPPVPSDSEQFMLQGMTYKVTLSFDKDPASDVRVQSWTSQCDQDNPAGSWHGVDLIPIERQGNLRTFGQTVLVTSVQDFDFTFRVFHDGQWRWSHAYECNGHVVVFPPRDEDKWTQGPDFDLITGDIHVGNFIAACHWKECGFTHVLNVADTLDIVLAPDDRLVYHKVPMEDGSTVPIKAASLIEAVDWLRQHNRAGNKILLNCRAGIGRAGSTIVAFVFAENPWMSYEEARLTCYSKRFVYPHVGLEETLLEVFPRAGRAN
ncbi:hypothetical protein CAPTEDRAFT_202910 [Capitella teleta]|uniref:Tyrosine specific protein phosphatases domain-containing protein n=1 Tax=Capitella teleta TaxID=283909 RepID=R7TUF3_CAPTE|nr:hypothetical protein CAPTEDRAFT_202910 [Capitella teleta]|eukprot:ELT97543.1 hypothetical protein CAPTEDRAFT_202910 [Capitella teleta]